MIKFFLTPLPPSLPLNEILTAKALYIGKSEYPGSCAVYSTALSLLLHLASRSLDANLFPRVLFYLRTRFTDLAAADGGFVRGHAQSSLVSGRRNGEAARRLGL